MEDKFMEDGHSNIILRKPGLVQVGVLYSVCVLLLLFAGSRFQRMEFYSGILITEFILILVPALLLLKIYRYDMAKVLRLNRINLLNIALIVCLMASALPLVGILNLLNLLLIKGIFGKLMINQPPVATDFSSLVLNILVIGGAAGICEEVLFRGIIQRGFERFGAVKSILLTSILFGLMHVDFQKLLGTFLLGAIIGFIVYRSNSLFGGMVAHFTNNSIAVILAFLANLLTRAMDSSGVKGSNGITGDIDMSFFNNLPKDQQTIAIIVWIIMAVVLLAVFGGLFALFLYLFVRRTKDTIIRAQKSEGRAGFGLLFGLLPGLAAICLIYFVQGLRLKGISLPAVESILGLLGLK